MTIERGRSAGAFGGAEDAARDLAAERRAGGAHERLGRRALAGPPRPSTARASARARHGRVPEQPAPGAAGAGAAGAGAAGASRAVSISYADWRSTAWPYVASQRRGRDHRGDHRRVGGAHQGLRRLEPGPRDRRRSAPLREHRHDRLADPQLGEHRAEVVAGVRERRNRRLEGLRVVRGERTQRVLDAVAELGEDVVRVRPSGSASRRRRRRPWTGSAGRSGSRTCRKSFEAPVNSRCASSKKNTSLGLSRSPTSGRSW